MDTFCTDLDLGNATLLAQELMKYVEQFQTKQGDAIVSSCTIELPFAVKPDFNEDIITFANSSNTLYLLRFCAPDRHFTSKSSRLRVHTIQNHENDCPSLSPTALKLRIR